MDKKTKNKLIGGLIGLLIIALFYLLTSCSSSKHPITSKEARDSVNVKIETRTEYIPDTVFIEIPAERERQTVRDTTSHLETSYAVSDARLMADGTLYHSLENKAQKRPYEIKKEVIYRDSIVYRDRVVTETKNAKVPRELTGWQKTQIRGFWILAALLVLVCRKRILALIRLIV